MTPALVFFAALSLNLLLNFGLGLEELASREHSRVVASCRPWLILFSATVLLWVFFALVLQPLGGILDSLLVFPLGVLGPLGLEELYSRFAPGTDSPDHVKPARNVPETPRIFKAGSAYSGLSAVSLVLTLHFAYSFGEAFLLSFAFSAGGLLASLIIREIQKRALLEAVPRPLRGSPLMFISAGILSLIFSALAVVFLTILM